MCACVLTAALALLTACGGASGDGHVSRSEITRWLRIAGHGDDPKEVMDCLSTYMADELTQEELRVWLALDPRTATAERVQNLPRAIEIADRCRGIAGY